MANRIFTFFLLFSSATFLFYASSITPLKEDADLWFHVKSGEYILSHGLPSHDVFSYTAQNRPWLQTDWGFQVLIYSFTHVFGLKNVGLFIGLFSLLQSALLFILLRKVLKTGFYAAFALTCIYTYINYLFFAPRPQIISASFLIINLGLLLHYVKNGKNHLWLTLPVTLLWSNMHSTVILDIFIFIGFLVVSLVGYLVKKKEEWFVRSKNLAAASIMTILISILPPLYLTQYRFLLSNLKVLPLLRSFISEMAPLSVSVNDLILYVSAVILALFALFISHFRDRSNFWIWMIPLVPFVLAPFNTLRFLTYGILSLCIAIGSALPSRDSNTHNKKIHQAVMAIALVISFTCIYGIKLRSKPFSLNKYPDQAVSFIKTNQLKGNMFNTFTWGGYLIYNLYPQQKVFIDNRAEMYFCCELPLLDKLGGLYNNPELLNKEFDQIAQKYHISFALFPIPKLSIYEKLSRHLFQDPTWALVFWDDRSKIFIKRDGLNEEVIRKFEIR